MSRSSEGQHQRAGDVQKRRPWWDKVLGALGTAWRFIRGGIWGLDPRNLTGIQTFAVRQLKILIFLYRQFNEDKLLMRASALTYSSLLAIVPFLAVAFAVSKGFGLHMNLAPALSNLLMSLGPRGGEIAVKILEFVENAQTGALGAVGFVALLFTAFGIVNRIDTSYNEIWHVPSMRAWSRRGTGYLALIVIGPLLALMILSVTASMTSSTVVQRALAYRVSAALAGIGLRMIPYILSCLLFALMIWFVPNVRVRWRAAIAGGILSGILWQMSNWGLARFVVGASHAGTREVLFAGFAALPLFLLWIYIGWTITFLGAELGYVVQYLGVMEWRELDRRHGEGLRRFVGVRTVLGIIRRFVRGEAVPSLGELAGEMHVPEPFIRENLEPLVTAGLLARSTDGVEIYLPARDPDTVTMVELLETLQGGVELPERIHQEDPFGQYVDRLLQQMDIEREEGAGGLSLRKAALEEGAGGPGTNDQPSSFVVRPSSRTEQSHSQPK